MLVSTGEMLKKRHVRLVGGYPFFYFHFMQQHKKNDRNGGIWQSGISKFLAEYVQRDVCFVNVQSSLHENVVFSVCLPMDNAAYIIFIMWSSISGLNT